MSLTASGAGAGDPNRDLGNFLQEVNLVPLLQFTCVQAGPNNQPIHTGTYTFRDVVVGQGSGTTIASAKRAAATQALQYFRTSGIPE